MLLPVVADSGNVRRHLDTVRQPDPGNFAERRVGLFRCRDEDADANPSLLRATLKGRAVRLGPGPLPPFAN